MQHGVVIVSDGVMVAALQWPDLRPTSVWILCAKDVLQAARECGLVLVTLVSSACGDDRGQKAQLGSGGIIVEGSNVAPATRKRSVRFGVTGKGFAGLAPVARHVQILAPPAGRRLKRYDDVRNPLSLTLAIPCGWFFQRDAFRGTASRRVDGVIELA